MIHELNTVLFCSSILWCLNLSHLDNLHLKLLGWIIMCTSSARVEFQSYIFLIFRNLTFLLIIIVLLLPDRKRLTLIYFEADNLLTISKNLTRRLSIFSEVKSSHVCYSFWFQITFHRMTLSPCFLSCGHFLRYCARVVSVMVGAIVFTRTVDALFPAILLVHSLFLCGSNTSAELHPNFTATLK
jgi:hypothetical protein